MTEPLVIGDLLGTGEVAVMLRCSTRTVQRLGDNGTLTMVRTGTGYGVRYYTRDSVERERERRDRARFDKEIDDYLSGAVQRVGTRKRPSKYAS